MADFITLVEKYPKLNIPLARSFSIVMYRNFLLIEGQNPIRKDVQNLLEERFYDLKMSSYSIDECREKYDSIPWTDYDLVLINCPYELDEGFAKLTAIKCMKQAPMVMVLTQSQIVADKTLQAGADNVYLHDDSLSDMAFKVENLLELKTMLKQYPFDVDAYQVHEVIHDSDDAIIYRATYQNKIPVAVKRFKYNLSELEPKLIHRLKVELESSVSLKHSGLVDFITYGISDHAFYLTMEYVNGGDLKSILETQGIPELPQAINWFTEIVNAVGAIHQSGLLHRDLKTFNILLKDDGSLALTDYGVEKNLLIAVGCLDEDEIYCTPYYVSPERVTGNCCTKASDIYSLGVIFYELLTGEKPFDAASLVDLMTMHVLAPIPALPDDLQQYQGFLEKLLAKCPDQRFANIDEILKSLRALQQNNEEVLV